MKPKKALGQNFFSNSNLGNSIVERIQENRPDIMVEIGPGQGFFTKRLIAISPTIILVEKDDNLADTLSKTFLNSNIINIDFLNWDMAELERYKGRKITFFGSLPYNVSKKIIKKILQSEYFNANAYFIIQKEVAEKYCDREPDNNFLSLETQLYAQCKKLFDISPNSFIPRPKVTSSFIKITPNSNSYDVDYRQFTTFLLSAFKQPRKTLNNNLKNYSFATSKEIDELLGKRPQHLSISQYIFLFSKVQ